MPLDLKSYFCQHELTKYFALFLCPLLINAELLTRGEIPSLKFYVTSPSK